MVIGNFKNSRGHLEAYTAIVQNDHIRPILGLITITIVINVEPVFLIRYQQQLPAVKNWAILVTQRAVAKDGTCYYPTLCV